MDVSTVTTSVQGSSQVAEMATRHLSLSVFTTTTASISPSSVAAVGSSIIVTSPTDTSGPVETSKPASSSDDWSDGDIVGLAFAILLAVFIFIGGIVWAMYKADLINCTTEYQPSKYEQNGHTGDVLMLQPIRDNRERLI